MPCGNLNEAARGCRGCHRLVPDCGEGTEGCCHCLPAWLCTTWTITTPETGGCDACDCQKIETRLPLTCGDGDPYYSGTIVCGSMSIDVKFEVLKDGDDDCSLCLTSTALGLACTPASSYSGGDKMSEPPHDPADEDGPSCCCLNGEWLNIDITGVTGAGTCTVAKLETDAASYVTPAWPDCSDCWDECACLACSLCVCLTRFDHTTATPCQECRDCTEVAYNPEINGWGPVELVCGDITETVTLTLTDDCELAVSLSGYTVPDQSISCPDIGFSVTLDDDVSDTVELHVGTRQCGEDCEDVDPPEECPECCHVMADIHCAEPEFTITISSNDCAELNATGTLTSSSGAALCVLFETVANADFCDPEATHPDDCDACALAGWSADLDCDTTCDADGGAVCFNSFLSFDWSNACCDALSGSTLGTLWPTACSCDPFSLTFEIPEFTDPCCSCDSNTCSDVVITITES